MAKKKSGVEMDLSSFMAVLIMTIGCLVVILVANTIIIVSNPENTRITSVVRSALYVEGQENQEEEGGEHPFPHGNKLKEPAYIDVRRDRLIIYPGEKVLPVRDLEMEGNAFEKLVQRVSRNRNSEYIVLLVRPGAAGVAQPLMKTIRDQEIDVGTELFEAGRPVNYEQAFQENEIEQ